MYDVVVKLHLCHLRSWYFIDSVEITDQNIADQVALPEKDAPENREPEN